LDIWRRHGGRRTSIHGCHRTIRSLIFRPTCLPHGLQTQLRVGHIGRLRIGLPEKLLYVPSLKKSSMRDRVRIKANSIATTVRFYGWTENEREVKMDMREMVDKVKKGEPLYGQSDLTPYMQGVAARNSRYSALMANVVPWANFVNHNQVSTQSLTHDEKLIWFLQHGVDTAKYYQQAERELDAEGLKGGR
jgi:hypothetical protein